LQAKDSLDMPDRTHSDARSRGLSLPFALTLFLTVMALLVFFFRFPQGYTIDTRILFSEWALIFVPCLVYILVFRVRPLRDLKIVPITPRSVLAVAITSISGILMAGELVVIQNEIIPIPPEYLSMLREVFSISGRISMPRAVFAFAVSPAICEELLFRGIILRGASRSLSPASAVVLTGVLFGLFHLDPYRFLDTMVLGFIMGYIAIKVESLLAAVVYHLTNNLLILLVTNLTALKEVPWLTEEAHLPVSILLLSVLAFAAGLRMIDSQGRQGVPAEPRSPEITGNISGDDS
jgi:sodium transport system permease protein